MYARNINDGNTLCDPSDKGSHITIRGACEATSLASQIGKGSHSMQTWLRRERWDCGKGELHHRALPLTAVLKVPCVEEGFWGAGYMGVFSL